MADRAENNKVPTRNAPNSDQEPQRSRGPTPQSGNRPFRDLGWLSRMRSTHSPAGSGLEAERLEQRVEPGGGRVRGGKPHVLLDRPPRQQARLLEDHAERAVRGERNAAV